MKYNKEYKCNFDYSFLRGKIVEKYKTINNFSKKLGCTSTAISQKLNNKTAFNQAEMILIAKDLGIDKNSYYKCFFTEKSE